ncbi:MAG: DUF3343 domain-containing protein [Anaerolineales bacterium]|nr:DUF3343 domain-containing protein [Anaerolineales bacterium]
MNTYGVVLFHTNSMVFRAEKVLARSGFTVKLIPTPRELSSDCGIALQFEWAQREQVEAFLQQAHVEAAGLSLLTG